MFLESLGLDGALKNTIRLAVILLLSILFFGGIGFASLRRTKTGPWIVFGLAVVAASVAGATATLIPLLFPGVEYSQSALPGVTYYEASYLTAATAFGLGWAAIVGTGPGDILVRWVRGLTVAAILCLNVIPYLLFMIEKSRSSDLARSLLESGPFRIAHALLGLGGEPLLNIILLGLIAIFGTVAAWIGGRKIGDRGASPSA